MVVSLPPPCQRNGHGNAPLGQMDDPVQDLKDCDAWMSTEVPKILASQAYKDNGVLFITWDESDFTGSGFNGFGDDTGCCDAIPTKGGGHVVTLVISHSNHAAVSSAVAYNHYSLLRTIQDGWQLGCLGFTCDTANVPAMSDLTGPKG